MDKKRTKLRKTIGKILNTISVVVVLLCLVLVVFSTVSLAKNRFVRFFGYSFHLVVTGSMEPEIQIGDLAVAQKTDKVNIKIGEDIVFVSQDPLLRGNMVVHRVVNITEDGAFRTQGIANGARIDDYPVIEPIGKVVAISAGFGKVFGFIVKYRVFVFVGLLLVLSLIVITEVISISYHAKLQKQREIEKAKQDNRIEGGEK